MHSLSVARPPRSFTLVAVIVLAVAAHLGCGDADTSNPILFADAEYDPAAASDVNEPIHESALLVAQAFRVLSEGQFGRLQIVLTQGPPGSEGMLQIDVRPLLPSGVPEPTDANSIITPIMVDSTTLPAMGVEEFTVIDLTAPEDRLVLPGDELAIVIGFSGRSAGLVDDPIALLVGRTGNGYPDGDGARDLDATGFVHAAQDFFFRTFVLRNSRPGIIRP